MKTIAEQLNIKDFPFRIKDKNENVIYYEASDKSWVKSEYDENWNEIYREDSKNFWVKREYDENGNEIYWEDKNGLLTDNRPKKVPEYTMEELTEILGKEFKIKK
jgi:hypothetical protein